MPISIEEFEKLPETTLHDKYVRKINEIGKELGFETGGLRTDLGILDCIWRLNDTRLLKLKFMPLVTFEVICSENQKALRGSFLNMLAMKPALAVFVLVEEGIRQSDKQNPEKWLKRVRKFVEKLKGTFSGILRIDIWFEKDIEEIYSKIVKQGKTSS